ncbi:MAG: hypothetical protein HUN04_00685 [Desulfobacter sp.]|nr:MAG: hypothetical protein HUN04_00685 [Desulfobacter sp.]
MTQVNPLNVEDLIRELGAGRATVKFILDRFDPWLSSQLVNGDQQYSPSVIPLLARIKDLLSSGMLPSQIEEIIENDLQAREPMGNGDKNTNNDIRMNPEAMSFIQDMVRDIRSQQERIAEAHEKRAVAEERKAAAIEKRAEAEEKKAAAMNNIASALQEMNQMRAIDAQSMEIAGQAAKALTMDGDMGTSVQPEEEWDDDDFEDPLAGLESLLDTPEPEGSDAPSLEDLPLEEPSFASQPLDDDPAQASPVENMDDLALLVDDPGLSEDDIDDLSSLIDTVSAPEPDTGQLDGLLEGDAELPELDNLSLLVDEAVPDKPQEDPDLDDLYSLVDQEENLDDLSALIDPPSETETDEETGPSPMDDLSLLVDLPEDAAGNLDDLWTLVDKKEDGTSENVAGSGNDTVALDDLSALIDPVSEEQPSLKPDVSPEEDLPKYKAAVMKIIIELKSQGLSANETTDRLNKDQVATLSGKPNWGEKAIEKIYGFIDSAK